MKLLPILLRGWAGSAAVFLDPPYTAQGGKRAGSRLYEHSMIDHAGLFEILVGCQSHYHPDRHLPVQRWDLNPLFHPAHFSVDNHHVASLVECVQCESGTNCQSLFAHTGLMNGDLLPLWLARVAGFSEVYLAKVVPFMRSPTTNHEVGRMDLVVSKDTAGSSWFGLEVQAVYFSGRGMRTEFEMLLKNNDKMPPQPTERRRPDWRSSSTKLLMPQLQVKAPTLRRWGTKLAVAVDLPFFDSIGGATDTFSHDLNDGDIIWLVPKIDVHNRLVEHHWEVLSLEKSSNKLLSAETIRRHEFETILRTKLQLIQTQDGTPSR